jgi:integrase
MRRGVTSDVKSPASRAAVPVPESLVPLLEERRAVAPNPDGLVFCRADGSPLPDSKPNAVLNAALQSAGLPHIAFHGLRRSWVMAHIEAGTPVKTIVTLGRWKSAQTFLDEYAIYLPATGGEAAQSIDDLICGQ